MLGNVGDILGVVKSMFSNFGSLIFLLIGVFVALWIFEKVITGFTNLPASVSSISKTESAEVGLFVKMAKMRGITFSKKNLLKGLSKQKQEKKYQSLLKKYGDIDVV